MLQPSQKTISLPSSDSGCAQEKDGVGMRGEAGGRACAWP